MAILGYKNSKQFVRAFGLAEWLETRGLAGWLEIATDGLEAPARQRIANEIEVHYAEAVGAHLAAGEPELSAQSTALAELGDPQEAAVNFQKRHLTESEAKSLKWMERTATKPLFSFRALPLDIIPLAAVALFLYHSVQWNSRNELDSHFFAGLALVAYVGYRLIPRLLASRTMPRNTFRKEIALCYLVTFPAVFLPMWLISCMQDGGILGDINRVLFVYLYGFRFNPGFRVWKKLRKMGDERHELPPWPTTAS
ncbi:MAG TPA: hypothetical protein VGR14_06190 [Verrucomicrobiae bacterium]|nr:hypothetical protein [Verrucomicrobiae bacterium]